MTDKLHIPWSHPEAKAHWGQKVGKRPPPTLPWIRLPGAQFADDSAGMAEGTIEMNIVNAVVAEWTHVFEMSLHTDKTVLMRHKRPNQRWKEPSNDQPDVRVMLDGVELKYSSSAKYLGITIKAGGSLKASGEGRIAPANHRLNQLRKTLAAPDIPLPIKTKIVETYVWPSGSYGQEVFSNHDMSRMSLRASVQRRRLLRPKCAFFCLLPRGSPGGTRY